MVNMYNLNSNTERGNVMNKNNLISLISIVIIVGSYTVVKQLGMLTEQGRIQTLILAFIMTMLLSAVVLCFCAAKEYRKKVSEVMKGE